MSGVSLELALGAGPASWDLAWEYLGESEKHASCDNTLQLNLRDREGRVVDEGCVMFVVTCFRAL